MFSKVFEFTLALGLAGLISSGPFVYAKAEKFDATIASAVEQRVGEKIGELRGSIDAFENTVLINEQTLSQNKRARETNLLPRPAWQPRSGEKALPPMVQNSAPQYDMRMTGSVRPIARPRIEWERFDARGNPIN